MSASRGRVKGWGGISMPWPALCFAANCESPRTQRAGRRRGLLPLSMQLSSARRGPPAASRRRSRRSSGRGLGDRFDPQAASRPATALATIQHSAAAGASLRFATASVVSPRLVDGCFSPAMHKPSRSRPGACAALLLPHGVGRPPARSDRPASADRAIGMRGNHRPEQSASAVLWRDCFDDRGRFGLATPLPREESPSHARRTTASPRLRGGPAAQTGRRPPRYSFARQAHARSMTTSLLLCRGERNSHVKDGVAILVTAPSGVRHETLICRRGPVFGGWSWWPLVAWMAASHGDRARFGQRSTS